MRKHLLLLLLLALICSACGNSAVDAPANQAEIPAPIEDRWPGLSWEEEQTLASLVKVSDFPIYTMHYAGGYANPAEMGNDSPLPALSGSSWACTLFAALGGDQMIYGRNFDWHYSPMLVLYTNPPEGYASISIVDLAYFGFDEDEITRLDKLPLDERTSLLDTPLMPFDGMNEHGLVVGMAAVPSGNMRDDPEKVTIDSLAIMREVLDHTRTVDEAAEIFAQYNIDYDGGPNLHYLIADRSGDAILIEFFRGEMHITQNSEPWHLATNFLCASTPDQLEGNCWRYDTVQSTFSAGAGDLTPEEGMDLLSAVSQNNTQWSAVYRISDGGMNVVAEREYADVFSFEFDLIGQ